MENLIALAILITAIPLGHLLKYLTPEELKPGKEYFKNIFIFSLITAIILLFIQFNDLNTKKAAIMSLFYITIVGFISWK